VAANVFMYLVLAVGAGLLSLGVLQLVQDLRRRDDKRVSERLAGRRSAATATTGPPKHLLRDLAGPDASLLARLIRTNARGKALQQFFVEADVPWPVERVLQVIAGIVLGVAAVTYFMSRQLRLDMSAFSISVMALSAGAIPLVVVAVKRKIRLNKFVNQLPDVFQLLGQALRGGHALVTGINLVGDQLPDPAGKEFARVFQEQNFGIKLEDALRNMAERVGLLDVRMFVTAVLIQRQTGGDLAEVLDKSSEVIRDRIKIAGQVKALTAEGRMSGWVLTALPVLVTVLAYRLNPDYMGELFWGDARFLLNIGIGLHLTGFVLIQKCIKVKY